MNILTIATAWGSEHGGLNVFNYRLCCSLALLGHHVTSYVKNLTRDALLDAQVKGVSLKSIDRSSAEKWSREDIGYIRFQELADFDIVIVHDIIGAVVLDYLPPPAKKRTVVAFIHTLYRDTDYISDLSDDERRARTTTQFSMISKADVVFTNGGWLTEQLLADRPELKGKVRSFIPGRLEIQPCGAKDEGSITTFGRLTALRCWRG